MSAVEEYIEQQTKCGNKSKPEISVFFENLLKGLLATVTFDLSDAAME
jgi:hypothetical protein